MLHRVLTDPKTIVLGILGGAAVGVWLPGLGADMMPLGTLYIAILSICILPIMITALIWGAGRMLRSTRIRAVFNRLAIVYVLGLFIPCVIGIAVALVLAPGAGLSEGTAAALGSQMDVSAGGTKRGGFMVFLQNIVPTNIFNDLSSNDVIAVVIFCIIAGLALGSVRSKATDATLALIHNLYEAFSKLFGWILVPLPIGLFALMGGIISGVDGTFFLSLIGYLGAFYVAGILILASYLVLGTVFGGLSPVAIVARLREPLLLAFVTNSPLIALRPSIDALTERFGIDEEFASTVIPFGTIANQHGQILQFAMTGMFLAQVYGIDITPGVTAILAIGSMLGGTAIVGGGAVLAPALAPLLIAIEVPDALTIVVLATTEQVVGPLVSMMTVLATCNILIIALGRRSRAGAQESAGPAEARDG